MEREAERWWEDGVQKHGVGDAVGGAARGAVGAGVATGAGLAESKAAVETRRWKRDG